MKHPILLVVALFLSIVHVSRRYVINGHQHRHIALNGERHEGNSVDVTLSSNGDDKASLEFFHRSIPQDLDKPVSFDDDEAMSVAKSAILQTLAARQSAGHHHAPYALWAHGHLVFLHHSMHGNSGLREEVRRFSDRNIDVDAVVLDAYWWHPASYLTPHPQLYNNGWRNDGPRVVLWMSAIVPTSCGDYTEGRQKGYFLHKGDYRSATPTPHIFSWGRKDGPALQGPLVDFTNKGAVTWLANKLEMLLRDNPQVMGVRCAGVDALVEHTADLFGAIGHIESSLYRSLYYRFFLDVGRKVRGPSFLMIGRAVDSFGNYHYQKFAPRESLFAGFVGDHPFTFPGLRESAMNVIHSAYNCYVNIGVTVGGSYLPTVETLEEFRAGDEGASLVELGLDDHIQSARQLERSYREADIFPTYDTADASSSALQCSSTSLRDIRERELFLRWLQFGSMLPFLINGGGARHNSQIWAAHPDADSAASVLYRRLVQEHRALALYYSNEAVDSLDHFFDSEFHYQNIPFDRKTSKLRVDPRAHHCSVIPLRKVAVSFSEPISSDAEWAMRVGDHLLGIPVMRSFGNTKRFISVSDLAESLDLSLLNSDNGGSSSHVSHEWVLVSDISQVFLLDAKVNDMRAAIPVPVATQAPLVLRRCDALIPLILPIVGGSPQQLAALVMPTALVFTVDSASPVMKDGTTMELTTRTTLTGDGDNFAPAVHMTVSQRTLLQRIGGNINTLQLNVDFLTDDSDDHDDDDANPTDSSSWSAWLGGGGMKPLWDSSLSLVSGYSEARPFKRHASKTSLPPECFCTFEPESPDDEHTRSTVRCTSIASKRVPLSPQMMHERHQLQGDANELVVKNSGEDTRCLSSSRILTSEAEPSTGTVILQLLVASPIHGRFRCACNHW